MGVPTQRNVNFSRKMTDGFINKIFRVKDQAEFLSLSLEIFNYQYNGNGLYRQFVDYLGIDPSEVNRLEKIPFLPIEFFKTQRVITGELPVKKVFESSGTTGADTKSRHYITDLLLYEKSLVRSFTHFYGKPEDIVFFALLPSYVERPTSSLVYMVKHLTAMSYNPLSRIDNTDIPSVLKDIEVAKGRGEKIVLIGVSFALLECAELYKPDLSGVVVMETGGMKGRRKELTRDELHGILQEGLKVDSIHSEYGMTELLSQAYSTGKGVYRCPPWMKVILRDTQDPLSLRTGECSSGGINVIDLANINSCSFIATSDLGRVYADGSFEVLGRFDQSDIRGCNLMSV